MKMVFLMMTMTLIGCSTKGTDDFHRGFAQGVAHGCTQAMYSIGRKPLNDEATIKLSDFERKNRSCVERMKRYLQWANQQPKK